MKRSFLALLPLLAFLIYSCQKPDNLVIDSSQPINVELKAFDRDSVDIAQYLGSQTVQQTISDNFTVGLNSTQGFGHLEVKVENDSGSILALSSFTGQTGGQVSGTVSIAASNLYVGDLAYIFTAFNAHGTSGNPATKFVRLFNSRNHAPVVDSVVVPDSVKLDTSLTTLIDINAIVHDADGLNDIARTYFNSTRPNGQPSSGNPFNMYDDGGASGAGGDDDNTAGDGVYSLQIQLPPSTTKGTYVFTFYAVDRSNATSSPVSHNIVVY